MGQTKRNIKTRGLEHKRNARNKEIEKSAVAKHYWEGHDINFTPKLVKSIVKNHRLNVMERLEIYKNRDRVMNTDLDGVDDCLFQVVRKKERNWRNLATVENQQSLETQQERQEHAQTGVIIRRSERIMNQSNKTTTNQSKLH